MGRKEEFKKQMETKNKIKGGLADGKSLSDLVAHHGEDSWASIQFESLERAIIKQIEKGTKVESEHTDDEDVALEIAFDHIWEDPKYYEKLETVEESKLIRKLFKEAIEINTKVVDESPDSISVLITYNGRNAGVVMVAPSTETESSMEIVGIKIKQDFNVLYTLREMMIGLFTTFPDINSFIVAPQPKAIQTWNTLGFNRISPNYLIRNRGTK